MIRAKDLELQDTIRLKDTNMQEISKNKETIIIDLTNKLKQAQRERAKIEEEGLASQVKWDTELKRING